MLILFFHTLNSIQNFSTILLIINVKCIIKTQNIYIYIFKYFVVCKELELLIWITINM
ncbi:hypothetical protein C2G38_2059329 [Gigaspora rosea]|uniref:Uncharacterized protein n=1 Tax=Gigaspora rosea TaxID=44941 RepID=A0A397W2J0_9GLOM|nr:hypothetical protein C2G38_2059329 [Gigaspora rosea]